MARARSGEDKPSPELPALLKLNPELDRPGLASFFERDTRIQIRDVLAPDAAHAIAELLVNQTPWGMSWQAAADGPHRLRQEEVSVLPPAQLQALWGKPAEAASRAEFAFIYSQYQMYDAHVQGWSASPAHDRLMVELNSGPFLDFVREVTGLPQIRSTDAQATLFGPQQFLTLHQDLTGPDGRLVAYVLNFCTVDWRPDWGGYLNFFDEHGNIEMGYRPRFNALNMFRVPQHHAVSFVPPFAPFGRFAITGWFRDR